jgi:hypothetical protein
MTVMPYPNERSGKDLTFISNNYYLGQNPMQQNNPMMNNNLQMIEMQRAMLQTQMLLFEQRRLLQGVITSEGNKRQQLHSNENLQIEHSETIIQNNKNDKIIDVNYKIIEDDKTTKEEEKEAMGNTIEEEEKYKDIQKSLTEQINSNKTVPYLVNGKLQGSTEGSIIYSPIVFTVRNTIWRDRVRFAVQNINTNHKDKFRKEYDNQENLPSVIVVLHNANKIPVEILAITQIDLEIYSDNISIFKSFVSKEDSSEPLLNNLVNVITNSFGIKNLSQYFQIFEPCIESSDIPPVIMAKDDTGMLSDVMRIKPVLSFGKKEQLITFGTYSRAIFKRYVQN